MKIAVRMLNTRTAGWGKGKERMTRQGGKRKEFIEGGEITGNGTSRNEHIGEKEFALARDWYDYEGNVWARRIVKNSKDCANKERFNGLQDLELGRTDYRRRSEWKKTKQGRFAEGSHWSE